MKLNIKIILILVVGLIVFGIWKYINFTQDIFKEAQQMVYSKDQRKILCINYEEPIMSYGSGHKVLRLYTSYYLLIAKNKFGEHPLEIKKWEGKDIDLEVKSSYKENKNYIEYVTDWVKRNKKIWNYNLHYKIITADKRIIY